MIKVNRLADMEARKAERAALKQIIHDKQYIEDLRHIYRVSKYRYFPLEARDVYKKIAGCFPGVQVYACGSRVRGDYIEKESLIFWQIKDARMKAGMAPKEDSDFDFWVAPEFMPVSDLPPFADRCRLRIPKNEKIPLPMWDFSKLPESEHARVKALLSQNDIQGLVKIHDKYQLSEYSYCCSGIEGVRNWFTWAIEQGIVK